MWAGLSCFVSSGDGYVGGLLELQQVCEGPLEFLDVRCDYPRDASAEMGLILPGGENLLDFLEFRQVLSSYDGDLKASFNFMASVTICSDFGAQKNKV